jgi:ABC-type glycerol-3-phosphate transport system substrate-binding protein
MTSSHVAAGPGRQPGGRVTRRRLAGAGLAAGGAAAVLTACAQPGGQAGQATQAESKAPLTLRWGYYAEQPVIDTVKKTLPVFLARHSNYTVTEEVNKESGLGYAPQLAAGDAPDVMAICCWGVPVWAEQGLLTSLDAMIKRDGREVPLADFAPLLMGYWTLPQSGGLFALPMSAYTRGMYFNKNSFKRKGLAPPDAGWDWTKIRDSALALNEPGEQHWGFSIPLIYETTGHFIRGNGGWHVDPKDNRKAAFDSPQALEALQWLHDRIWKDKTFPLPAEVSATGLQAFQAVATGNLAMAIDGSWKVTQLITSRPAELDQWDVIQLPKGPAQRDTHASTDGWAIFKGTKQTDASWQLMKFLQSEDWLEPAISTAGHLPARKSWLDRFATLMKKAYPALNDKNLNAFTDGHKSDYARPLQLFRRHLDSAKIFDETIQAVLIRNERPVADAFRDAARQINAINAG